MAATTIASLLRTTVNTNSNLCMRTRSQLGSPPQFNLVVSNAGTEHSVIFLLFSGILEYLSIFFSK